MRALFVSMAVVSGCKTLEQYNQAPDPTQAPALPTQITKDCNNYTYNGQTYDCSTMDACDFSAESIPVRVACCDCDPALCEPVGAEDCPDGDIPPPPPPPPEEEASSCMECHNGSNQKDYKGTGISNPHWVSNPAAQYLECTQCHGGNPDGLGKDDSHVPRPPELGDDAAMVNNPVGYWNYLTRQGLDKFPDYTVGGTTYTALDFIQFLNPGDVRAVGVGRSCGNTGCHVDEHAKWFSRSNIFTESGFYSNTFYTIGSQSGVPESADLYSQTASDYAYRDVTDPSWVYSPEIKDIGKIPRLVEVPEYAAWGDATGFYNNPAVDANQLAAQRYAANDANNFVNQVYPGSWLEKIVFESIVFQCGDCHAGASGANNRYADFRSSGCTVCHMKYSNDGRSLSTDPNVPKYEPANPDAIAAPERPHIKSHTILNVAKYINTANGMVFVSGVDDATCVGCHQGSNRTVLQYWGVRLDQNQDLVNNFQYPANPNTFVNTAQNQMLYDPAVQNATFNGRNANQYIDFEDYDADGRNDIRADQHYLAGMGCIDCHGSRDTHNGTKWKNVQDGTTMVDDPGIYSKMDQTVGVACESCHGTADYTADTMPCEDYEGNTVDCAIDRFGNPMRNVVREAAIDGTYNYWLTSRLDQVRHYLPQVHELIVDTNKRNPLTGLDVYSPNASYAMGRANDFGNQIDGVGPMQTNPNLVPNDFSHMDTVDCQACHSVWSNGCFGCHLQLQYNANPANFFFSNQTGERIVVQVTNADFTYITPLWNILDVSPQGMVSQGWGGMKPYYRYVDINGNLAAGLTFSDRHGSGSNPAYQGRSNKPAMSHNRIMAHSIGGRITAENEGTNQCVACHLNVDAMNNFGADYIAFWQNYVVNQDYNFVANTNLYAQMQQFIGQNTQNQANHPYFVAKTVGVGTATFTADAFGCPVNTLDNNANRIYCVNGAPANNFDPNNIAFDWDRVVQWDGTANASLTKPIRSTQGGTLRSGALDATLAGPLGAQIITKLADPVQGRILDSWIDANGNAQGDAANYIQFDAF